MESTPVEVAIADGLDFASAQLISIAASNPSAVATTTGVDSITGINTVTAFMMLSYCWDLVAVISRYAAPCHVMSYHVIMDYKRPCFRCLLVSLNEGLTCPLAGPLSPSFFSTGYNDLKAHR